MKSVSNKSTVEYLDYKKFTNFIDNKYDFSLKSINPYEYFRVGVCQFTPDVNKKNFALNMFKGRMVNIPFFNIESSSFNRFVRFEDFTSINEVTNLSLWALSWTKKLSYDTDVRLGKELEIIQEDNPRDGRLDVVALCQEQILIYEVKVGLASLLREGRYKYQIPTYLKESTELIKKHNRELGKEIRINIILLIGGDESDIYPPFHPDCTTGQVGNISSIFYDSIPEYNIKFVTANALWSIAAYSEILKKKLYWNKILPNIFLNNNNIGLLSGGIAKLENKTIDVVPIDLSIYI